MQIGLGDDQDAQGYREVYQSGWADQLFSLLVKNIKSGVILQQPLSMRNYQQ